MTTIKLILIILGFKRFCFCEEEEQEDLCRIYYTSIPTHKTFLCSNRICTAKNECTPGIYLRTSVPQGSIDDPLLFLHRIIKILILNPI